MAKIFIEIDIDGDKLGELIDFILMRSDTISVARYYLGFIDEEQFVQMQEAYKSKIYKEDKERREKYKYDIDGYKSLLSWLKKERDANEYFNDILEQDFNIFDTIKYDDYIEKPDTRFVSSSKEFIKNDFTRITPVTQGPVFEMCYFKIGQISNLIVSNMKRLFSHPYLIDGIEYEDLTFYNGGNIIFAICSHERYAYLELNIEDYEIFKKLEIMHTCK